MAVPTPAPSEVPIAAPVADKSNGTTAPPATTRPSDLPSTNGSNAAAAAPTTLSAPSGLSTDEMALYDRQIRLWGAQAQERIRSANILLVSLRALGTEIAKNLTLAGISSLTIVDDSLVTEDDLGAQFFLREDDVGKKRAEAAIPRIRELNPRVTVQDGGGLDEPHLRDPAHYSPYDCVVACDLDFASLSSINTAVRFASRPFYGAGIHGFYGWIFADLVRHNFVIERQMSNVPTVVGTQESMTRSIAGVTTKKEDSGKAIEVVQKTEVYCPLILANTSPLPPDVLSNQRKLKAVPLLLPCLRALWEFQQEFNQVSPQDATQLSAFTTMVSTKSRELQMPSETLRADFVRSFVQSLGAEMSPAAAFIGGRVSEDVINVLGQREQPIQNFALFDGDALEGRIYSLYTTPPELALPIMPMALPADLQTNMSLDNTGLDLGQPGVAADGVASGDVMDAQQASYQP